MSAEVAVQAALMAALRSDAGVQAIFGASARVYDDETEAPAFPFARLERHECRPVGASGGEASEHVITLAVLSRHGGLRAAKAALSSRSVPFTESAHGGLRIPSTQANGVVIDLV